MNALQSLVHHYKQTNHLFPTIQKIVGSSHIDHVALRFIGGGGSSQQPINRITQGYQLQPEVYTFHNYDATARWYKYANAANAANADIPRLFISTYNGDHAPSVSSFAEYQQIHNVNSYLAWTSLFAGHVNHIALQVNDIETATESCIKHGILMNYEGGLYKISKDKQLIQTATKALSFEHTFANGDVVEIPYTFVELVQRYNNREGFEQENARRIFTSTD